MYQVDNIVTERNLRGEENDWKILRVESTATSGLPQQYYAERLRDGYRRCVGHDMICNRVA